MDVTYNTQLRRSYTNQITRFDILSHEQSLSCSPKIERGDLERDCAIDSCWKLEMIDIDIRYLVLQSLFRLAYRR